MGKRYLTKSRFKLATECPTKLYYTGKKEYANQSLDDPFLLALANGGFQVGELAKYYFPEGVEVTSTDHDQAIAETNKLLEQENATIYEAAIATDSLFIRADILVKAGNRLKLYEVKAKSYDPREESPFENKNGTIKPSWLPYLYDAAFQKHVIQEAFPDYEVQAHLVLADKSSVSMTEGLNQKFKIIKDSKGRKSVKVSSSLSEEDLEHQLLCKINVDRQCSDIYSGTYTKESLDPFKERISLYAEHYLKDEKINTPISKQCASCEFYTKPEDEKSDLKNGKKECWITNLGWKDNDFEDPTVLDIWSFRKKEQLLQSGHIKMIDVCEEDIAPKPDDKAGISPSERQWLQVEKVKNNDNTIWIDREGLSHEFDQWRFPLHFIDFETTMVAIPFNKGRHPYEGIAFQFSHHIVQEDGSIEHHSEYLNTDIGAFPNYDFVRQLKLQLEKDSGTIFRYSNHENSYLNLIFRQLKNDEAEIQDREELCEFIQSITKSPNASSEKWHGDRCMVDLWELVKRYYYDPATNGSNSIKQVLPAILNSSQYLQEKYSRPIYGSEDGIFSHNFKNWQWIQFENGQVIDPYKQLPKMFSDIDDKDIELLSDDSDLKDGGAALTAYARMQFEEMSDYERKELNKALLKYCELDTLAMVMIYESWRELLKP